MEIFVYDTDTQQFSKPASFKEKLVNCFNQFNDLKLDPEKIDAVMINSNKVTLIRHFGIIPTQYDIHSSHIFYYFGPTQTERRQQHERENNRRVIPQHQN